MPNKPPSLRPTWATSLRRAHDQDRKDDPDRRFLQSREWRERIRPRQLSMYPKCEHCEALGVLTIADEVDHVIRPRGDWALQRDHGNHQSLCKSHHVNKSLWERRADGTDLVIGTRADGWPVRLPGGRVRKPGTIE